MVEKGMTCVKYLLFFFNLLFFIFGAVLIGVGAYAQIKLSAYNDFAGQNINGAAIVVIIVGVVTFVVGFFGCWGAIRENHCMVMTFAALIAIILICELGVGIAGYVLRGKIEDLLKKGMKSAMSDYSAGEKTGIRESWDNLQKELKCCGTTDYNDWKNVTGFEKGKLPKSCCKSEKDCTNKSGDDLYTKGCLSELEKTVKNNIGVVAGVGIGLAVVELVGIILACCLARAIKSEYEVA